MNDLNSFMSCIYVTVWGFSVLACFVMSAVSLIGVAIIPAMHKVIYKHLLQFLVALAIGSMTGDAILHLLPHVSQTAVVVICLLVRRCQDYSNFSPSR